MNKNYFYKTDLGKIPDKPLTDKCIVLDLDETLVHSHGEGHIELLKEIGIFTNPDYLDLRKRTYKITMDDVVHKKGQGAKTEMWGITRPHLTQFLIFCFSYFKVVAVWSAGRNKYVNCIVDHIFKDLRRPHVIWNYDDLSKLPDNTLIKPLSKMSCNVSGLSKYMTLENTFIIDDRTSVFQQPNPNNGVQIPAYRPSMEPDSMRVEDNRLHQLMNWFKKSEVIKCKDVRKLDKTRIFANTQGLTKLNKSVRNL